MTPGVSDWLEIGTLALPSGQLALADPLYLLDASVVVAVSPGAYIAEVRVAAFGADRRIAALRIRQDAAVVAGTWVGTVGVDFGQVCACDLDLASQALLTYDRAAADTLDQALDAIALAGLVRYGGVPEAVMVVARSGFGDGNYPVFALGPGPSAAGAIIEFIDPAEAYPFAGAARDDLTMRIQRGRQ